MSSVSMLDDSMKLNSSWQMEVLMEKLRSKACSLRSLPETAKAIKQSILNKQHILDPSEKTALGQCLDKLQENIKVTTLAAMVERLEATAKQLGLQFTSGTSGPEVYISCDMFYVEVHLQTEGKVRDVKVELAGDQLKPRGQSSPELVECLSSGNFSDFTAHLEGFLSIYKLNTEKKNKCKAYQALQALEHDLLKLFEMAQDTITDTQRLIFKSPVGLLINRKGGHPVNMIYFTSPYELLDVAAQKSVSLTFESASTMDLAHSVSVNMDASSSHKLQTTSLVNIIKGSDGLKLPSISGLNSSNSVSLPAYFTLKLKKPMAVSFALATKISDVTGIPCFEAATKKPLLQLIIREASNVPLDNNNNKGLFVTLPDQQHCYFVSSGPSELEGVLVDRVPFTHPTSVAHILEYLRMQAIFNALIESCVRPASRQELDNAFIFEVCAVSHELISVTFEHPEEESTATAELDLTDLSNVKCRLFTLAKDLPFCSDEYATKVLQRCLSIPVTMRALIRKVAKEEKEVLLPQGDSVVKMENSNVSPSNPNQNTKFFINDYSNLGMKRDQVVPQANNFGGVVTKTPLPTQPVAAGGPSITSANSHSSTTSVTYGPLSSVTQKNQFQTHFLVDSKVTKVRKRKPAADPDGKSPKHSEDGFGDGTKKGTDPPLIEASLHLRKDLKLEKVSTATAKRRSSTDGLNTAAGTSELAALREKVYGAESAANFAKLSYLHTKESKVVPQQKLKKNKAETSVGVDTKKSPIVLDLTETVNSKKSSSGHSTPSSALSAALLKRPGIEIIPIPGSNTPISIPSSITVTPVMKSSEDKYRDKKDRRDKKDTDKKDKKRRRDDSPSGNRSVTVSSSSPLSSGKSSKLQIISAKQSPSVALENTKGEKASGVTMKPTSFQSPVKKPTLSPTLSQQKSVTSNKVSFSPTNKTSKLIYSPSLPSLASSSTTSKVMTSSKQSSSPKHLNLSPKHSSMGKPSMNALKTTSPTFSKPSSLSPKLSKLSKEKEKSCSPSRVSVAPVHAGSPSVSPTSTKSKSSSSSEKLKSGFPDALTITKVPPSESISPCASASPPFSSASPSGGLTAASLLEKLSMEKAKASPPKNRKGSSLSDIVDKLRAGVSGSSDSLTLIERKEKEKKEGGKKDGDNFMMKSNSGLKFTFNKAKSKESSNSKSGSSNYSSPSKSSFCKSPSGLKPGTTSAPASKKVSVSSLPPIPKLSPSSVSSANSSVMSPMTSPLHYNRDRQTKEKERSQTGDATKLKDNAGLNKTNTSSSGEIKRDSKDTTAHGAFKNPAKEERQQSKKNPASFSSLPKTSNDIDSVDRALKNMFGEEPDTLGQNLNFTETDPVKFLDRASAESTPPQVHETKSTQDLTLQETTFDQSVIASMPPPSAPLPAKPSVSTEAAAASEAANDRPSDHHRDKDVLAGGGNPAQIPTPLPPHPPRISSPPGVVHPSFPHSPSVSIKIVKSPAPVTSPLNMISPQSVSSQHSPCIIDDELMDEALMGPRK